MILVVALFLAVVLVFPTLTSQVGAVVIGTSVIPGDAVSVVFQIDTAVYFLDNQITGVEMDVAPFIRDGRTLVPIRFLANALGVDCENINWNNDDQVATLSQPGFPVVKLVIGQKFIVIDGETVAIDVAPLIEDGRTMLPARFVAEALGYQVTWKADQQVVLAWPKGEPQPGVGKVLEHLVALEIPEVSGLVTFKCENLEKAIRGTIGKPTGVITQADMLEITSLDPWGTSDLRGLEHATNLTSFRLSDTLITDISALSGLTNLTELYLRENPLSEESKALIETLRAKGIWFGF